MKVSPPSRFWAQRPRLTARRLELACWIIGAALTVALLQGPALAAGSPGGRTIIDSFVAQDVVPATALPRTTTFIQERCVKRVLALTQVWPTMDIGQQLARQCFPRSRPGGYGGVPAPSPLTCGRPVSRRPAMVPGLPAGCS